MSKERYHIVAIAPSRPFGQFQELAETLFWGLRNLGCKASMAPNGFSEAATNIVLGAGRWVPQRIMRMIPGGSIIYLTEPIMPTDTWTSGILPELVGEFEVWDYSQRNVDLFASQGMAASFVPIGYVPQLSRISKAADQEIDVLFYGDLTERRTHIIEELRSYGLSVCAVDDCYGSERDGFISRAKLVLNMHHHDASNIFEMVRVSYLLANRKAIVAEIDEDTDMDPRLSRAVAGVVYDELTKTCLELVGDAAEREALEERGFTIMSSLLEEDYLRPVLERRQGGDDTTISRSMLGKECWSDIKTNISTRKTCLLISPPDIGFDLPRGVLEIASFLQANGISTLVLVLAHELDYHFSGGSYGPIDEWHTELILRDAIRRTNPLVVGVSNPHTLDYPDCLKILEICKQIDETIVTVIGGHHVTFQDLECAALPFVDVVVRGEGEWTLLELVSAVEQGMDLATVQGLTFKRGGQLIRTPARPLGDLRDLPPVDFELLPPDFVRRAAIYGTLSRGCSFACAFCAESAFWKKRRVHPVQRLIDEMKTLQREYGRPMDAIEGSMIAIGSRQSLELCSELVHNKIDLPRDFYIYSRVDTITDEGLQALKTTSIRNIWVGIETASAQVLKMMNKHISFDQTLEGCRRLRDNGFTPRSLWVIGHPGDNPQEAGYSLGKLKHLYAQQLINKAQPAIFVPYPGTPFFDHPERYGIEIITYDWRRWDRWSGHSIYQLKDFTADQIADFYQKTLAVVRSQERIENYVQHRGEYRWCASTESVN